jgi:hypothetical protein
VHAFPNGTDESDFLESGSAEGIGDMVVRGKYNFLRNGPTGMAAAVDWRLPTGKEEDLLGSGATQVKMYLIAAHQGKHFAPRVSAGYTAVQRRLLLHRRPAGRDRLLGRLRPRVHRRVTFTADFLGRTLRDTNRVVIEPQTFRYVFRTDPAVKETTRLTPVAEQGNLGVYLGSARAQDQPGGPAAAGG